MNYNKIKNRLIRYLLKNFEYGSTIYIDDIAYFSKENSLSDKEQQIILSMLINDKVAVLASCQKSGIITGVKLTEYAYKYIKANREAFILRWYPHLLSTIALIVSIIALIRTF